MLPTCLLGFGRICANIRLKMASISFDACPETLQEVISATVVIDIHNPPTCLLCPDRSINAGQLANLEMVQVVKEKVFLGS